MKYTFATTAIIALIAGTASADGLSYGYGSFEFSNYSADSGDADAGRFVGAVEYEVNQVLFSADFDHRAIPDAEPDSFTFYTVGAAFQATPEILAGVGVTGLAGDFDGTNGFEVFGQYSTNQYGVALNVAKPDNEFDDVVTTVFGTYQTTPDLAVGLSVQQNSEDDGTLYELSAGYSQGPFDVRGYYDGFSEADAGYLGVHGTYEVTPDIRVLAGYLTAVGNDAPSNFGSFRIGGGYQVAQTAWVDAFYGQISGVTAVDLDRFGIQLTFETGARQRIDNAFKQNNIDDQTASLGPVFNVGS